MRSWRPERGSPVGFLEHAVDHAAAAAEGHRVGAFEHLDALSVVEVAVVARVVADAVDEEVGRRALAPDQDRVAVALGLGDGNAGNVAQSLADRLDVLVADLRFRHHRDRLRRVDQGRVGLGGGSQALGDIADLRARTIDHDAVPEPGTGEADHVEGDATDRGGRGERMDRLSRRQAGVDFGELCLNGSD